MASRPMARLASSPHPRRPPGTGDLLRTVAAGTAGVVGEAFFRALVRHVAVALGADLAFAAELPEASPGRARVLAAWPSARLLPEGFEYPLGGRPCEAIGREEVVSVAEGAIARFPHDAFAAAHRLDGYLGVAMRGAGGRTIGYLAVQSTARLDVSDEEVAALRIFGARAGAEIERRRHEVTLRAREAELAASRARVVQAADEERRRIGRDLHDGVQQRLVVLGHCLELARRELGESAAHSTMLAQAKEHAASAGRELRELARGLHPVMLSDRGLEGALRSVAASSPVPLVLRSVPDRRLPPAIETTAYFMVSEALTNAARYANASQLTFDVEQDTRWMLLTVADDGDGGADLERGTGLAGLRNRVEALGGTLEVVSPPGGGTRLQARIPTAPWRHPDEPMLEFGYEGDGGLGEDLIARIVAGRKRATVSVAREWDLEGGPPRIGQQLPVLDHHGVRRATVVVTRVASLALADIGEEVVDATSAGTATVEEWRAEQRRFYDGCRDEIAVLLGQPGWRLTEDEPMVITWFDVVDDDEA
jgi:signal transduction histidine kinase/uncharacterized protein YhfF